VSPAYPRELGRAFEDDEVARKYRYRQPYPSEVFEILRGLLVEPGTVLDAGSGTGALTIGLAQFAKRVDAIDPSAAMLREARRMPGADNERIRWIQGTAENAPLDPPYGLVTTGASLHWMDPDIVMPRFGEALAPGARVAIVDTDSIYGEQKWRGEFLTLIRAFSPIAHHITTPTSSRCSRPPGALRWRDSAAQRPSPSSSRWTTTWPCLRARARFRGRRSVLAPTSSTARRGRYLRAME